MIANREQLFAAYPRKSITLASPDVEGLELVFVEFSVKDKIDYTKFAQKEGVTTLDLAAFVIARSAEALNDEDAPMILNRLSVDALTFFSTQVLKLSGMTKESQEEAEKN